MTMEELQNDDLVDFQGQFASEFSPTQKAKRIANVVLSVQGQYHSLPSCFGWILRSSLISVIHPEEEQKTVG